MFESFQKRGNASQPKGFFGSLLDNIKDELNKNKDIKVRQTWILSPSSMYVFYFLKDNIKKFREQAKKLEDSDALKDARDKYVS